MYIDDLKDTYDLKQGGYCFLLSEKITEEVKKDTVFHIEHCNRPVATLKCTRCGGTEFNVGKENYFTAIRCVVCKWEQCIHEG